VDNFIDLNDSLGTIKKQRKVTDTRANMNYKKIILLLFIFWVMFAGGKLLIIYTRVYHSHKEAEVQLNKQLAEQERINKMSYVEMVEYIAPQFNQNPEEIKKIIYNESGFKVQCHDSCRAKNVTAIHDSTFKGWLPKYEKEMGETLNIESQFDHKDDVMGFQKRLQDSLDYSSSL